MRYAETAGMRASPQICDTLVCIHSASLSYGHVRYKKSRPVVWLLSRAAWESKASCFYQQTFVCKKQKIRLNKKMSLLPVIQVSGRQTVSI